jgi:transmembrane sensor
MSKLPETDKAVGVTEQASQWWVLLNSGPATAEDQRAFAEWVARSPERVEAFLQTARMTKVLKSEALRWPDTAVEELAREIQGAGDVVPLNLSRPEAKVRLRGPTWLAIAASLLGVIFVSWLLVNRGSHYETEIGEQRSVVLADGSVVTLNTASRIDVEFEKAHRTIRLAEGEALFQVAHDPARPFDVVVGNTRVRAVGTQFNVIKRAAGTTVTVVEGKVAVMSETSSSPTHVVQSGTKAAHLTAGQQLTLATMSPVVTVPTPADVATATAWTQRRLVFDRRSLGDVAEEFNRYNHQVIHIDSAQLRSREVTAVFQANDPESFLDFISGIPGIKIERDANRITVSDSP